MTNKKLQDMTIKDDFMFGAVMCDPENCKGLLERVLDIQIEQVVVDRQKNLVYNPEYKGVRLDIIAKDENQTHYNVEMQVVRRAGLVKRTRYYHSQIDMELLLSGMDYQQLPATYVIFICDFDPFERGRHRYSFEQYDRESAFALEDGIRTVFLNTKGQNREEISKDLGELLHFINDDRQESSDPYILQLKRSISEIKQSREMGERYMLLKDMLKDERAEGRAEGLAEGRAEIILGILGERGSVPDQIRQRIFSQTDTAVLVQWTKNAARVSSIEEFVDLMDE